MILYSNLLNFMISTAPRIPPARFCEESGRWVAESRARRSEERIPGRQLRRATNKNKARNNNNSNNNDSNNNNNDNDSRDKQI